MSKYLVVSSVSLTDVSCVIWRRHNRTYHSSSSSSLVLLYYIVYHIRHNKKKSWSKHKIPKLNKALYSCQNTFISESKINNLGFLCFLPLKITQIVHPVFIYKHFIVLLLCHHSHQFQFFFVYTRTHIRAQTLVIHR